MANRVITIDGTNEVMYQDGQVVYDDYPNCNNCCATTTTTTTTTTEASWDGDGYYCVVLWSGATCDDLTCQSAECKRISSQSDWDSYQFGTCNDSGETASMYTTDGEKHASETECTDAGCECG